MNTPTALHHLRKSKELWSELAENLEAAKEQIDEMEEYRRRMQIEMKVTDIARFFDRDPSTIHRWINSGKLKSKKMIHVLELKNRK